MISNHNSQRTSLRFLRWTTVAWLAIICAGTGIRVLADCASLGLPFADLGNETTFCAAIAEAYYTGITGGTSSTTFSPNDPLTRAQGAAFAVRTLDASLARGSRRAALGQWWTTTPHYDQGLGVTAVGVEPSLLASDGVDVWVANGGDATVTRVRASDGAALETWTGAIGAGGVLVTLGRVFITGKNSPGTLYMIDPTKPAGAVTTVASTLGNDPVGIAYDGSRIWTANSLFGSSVSIITPSVTTPWNVVTVSAGVSAPLGMLFDGTNIWVADTGNNVLKRLDSTGTVIQTVSVGTTPEFPAFDGHNIWVPNSNDNSLTVIRASDGVVVKTISGSVGLSFPRSAAFDGSRILVPNQNGGISVFNASTMGLIGAFPTPGMTIPYGACSDGINFWVSFSGSNVIGRF